MGIGSVDEDSVVAGVDYYGRVGGRSWVSVSGEMVVGVRVLEDGEFGHLLSLWWVFDSPSNRLVVG